MCNVPQKEIFLPQAFKPRTDADRLVDRRMQAFDTRGDEKSIKAHLAGDGMGHHVAHHHPVPTLPQTLQRMLYIFCTVHGKDVQIIVQQAAQCMC